MGSRFRLDWSGVQAKDDPLLLKNAPTARFGCHNLQLQSLRSSADAALELTGCTSVQEDGLAEEEDDFWEEGWGENALEVLPGLEVALVLVPQYLQQAMRWSVPVTQAGTMVSSLLQTREFPQHRCLLNHQQTLLSSSQGFE